MSKVQFEQARNATREFLASREIENHMFHGPVSDRYWAEKFRLVAINMESYGYDGHWDVDRETLVDWLYDAGDTGTRTTRYTLMLLAALNHRIVSGEHATPEVFRAAYADNTLLEETLETTVYYNIRPESNENKEQDFAAIEAVGSSELGSLIWSEIRCLEPHVILVSGHAGLSALNGMASLTPTLQFKETMIHPDGIVIQSIAHPSRPNYGVWGCMVEDVATRLEVSCKARTR